MNERDFVCGNCIHWGKMIPGENGAPVTIGEKPRGLCMGVPPTPFPVMDQRGQVVGQRNMRAITVEGERGCGLWDDGREIESGVSDTH